MLKKKMVEKGYVNDESQAIFKSDEQVIHRNNPLKWGLIILFGGMALIVLEFVDFGHNSPFPFGLVAFFIATALLIYYFVTKKELDKNANE